MRLSPASFAAAVKLVNDRVAVCAGSPWSVNGRSAPKNPARTVLAAALKVLCPEIYVGNGGVTSSGVQVGSAPLRMAVIGRQKLSVYFASQAAMPASASAQFSAKNIWAFWARL